MNDLVPGDESREYLLMPSIHKYEIKYTRDNSNVLIDAGIVCDDLDTAQIVVDALVLEHQKRRTEYDAW